jgi:hypothetical protein
VAQPCASFPLVRRKQLVVSAPRLGVPAIYPFREFPAAGGLHEYRGDLPPGRIYTGRILRGDNTADLPVTQPTTFELVINLSTARELGIDIPATLHARSDEVSGLMYTIRQSGGAKFYISRAIARSHCASTRCSRGALDCGSQKLGDPQEA